MQANGEKRKSKSKQWYRQNAKKSKKSCLLSFDFKGFLISCNFREKEAIREAYVLLNEYGDKLYGSEVPAVHDDPDEEVDIDTELENEKEALKLQVKVYTSGTYRLKHLNVTISLCRAPRRPMRGDSKLFRRVWKTSFSSGQLCQIPSNLSTPFWYKSFFLGWLMKFEELIM